MKRALNARSVESLAVPKDRAQVHSSLHDERVKPHDLCKRPALKSQVSHQPTGLSLHLQTGRDAPRLRRAAKALKRATSQSDNSTVSQELELSVLRPRYRLHPSVENKPTTRGLQPARLKRIATSTTPKRRAGGTTDGQGATGPNKAPSKQHLITTSKRR